MAGFMQRMPKTMRRIRTWIIRQTGEYTRFLFVFLFCATVVLSIIYHMSEVTFSPVRNDQNYFRTLMDILILLLSGFDVSPPGTTVGWITAFLLLVTNILFIGTIIQGIGEIILKAKGRRLSGMIPSKFTNHIVVFGLTRYTRAIIRLYLDNAERYGTRLVLVDEGLESMPPEYAAMPEWIEFVKGSPFREETLRSSNLSEASGAIICPRQDCPAPEADSHAMLVALAVERYNADVVTTLILRDRSSRSFLEQNTRSDHIKVEVDQVICPDEIVENLTASAALNPGLSSFILDAISFEEEGEERADEDEERDDNIIVTEDLPDDLFAEADWRERPVSFGDVVAACLAKSGGLVLGLLDESGQEVLPQGEVRVGGRRALVLRKESSLQ